MLHIISTQQRMVKELRILLRSRSNSGKIKLLLFCNNYNSNKLENSIIVPASVVQNLNLWTWRFNFAQETKHNKRTIVIATMLLQKRI